MLTTEELFAMKVSRAVDRIFSEHKLTTIHQHYVSLLEGKKSNTHALRTVLQKNYEKMLDCSELWEKIREFGHDVDGIATNIHHTIQNVQINKNKWAERTIIQIIQANITNQHYQQAMKMCIHQPLQNIEDTYYIQYLKIQILKHIEHTITHHNLTPTLLHDVYHTLHMFTSTTEAEKLLQICEDYPPGSLINMLHHKAQILQIVFRFKLGLLRECGDKAALQHYFTDLILLLSHQECIQMANYQRIFVSCTSTIKQHLAHIFVQKKDDGLVMFKNQLYDSLLHDGQFQRILTQFHEKLGTEENPIQYLHELWNNYVLNLIDYLSMEVYPSKFISLPSPPPALPKQLAIYLYDEGVDTSVQAMIKYEAKLSLFHRNIVSTLNRCTPQQHQKAKARFQHNMIGLREDCRKQLTIELRKYIFMSVCCCMWNRCIKEVELLGNHELREWRQVDYVAIWQKFSSTMLDFDKYFVGYVEQLTKHPHIQSICREVIEHICENILSSLLPLTKGKQHQNINYTLLSLKERKQKITIREILLLPYVGENIFKCEMKGPEIDSLLYGKYFNRKSEKIEEMEEDDFQIGEREQEVFKIGKSLMNIGNNFISGFMKK